MGIANIFSSCALSLNLENLSLAGGAEEAVRAVASERLGDLEAAITAGVPVFLDTSFTTRADQELLDTIRRR
ncbi:MAG: hypothetical protein O8C56_01905, partial [Candidatus Methanoperedens sp.]|nr:hypothetical protein [Candidatus Methanoperedens sp.]